MNSSASNSNTYWLERICKTLVLHRDGDKYVNPIRRMGASMFAFDAIEELGKNEWHEIETICEHTKRLMQSVSYEDYVSYWDSFTIYTKGIDANERLTGIVLKLQYMYGKRLKEIGCRVDVMEYNGKTYLRLNTKSVVKSKEIPSVNKHQKPSFVFKFINSLKSIIALVKWF